MSPLASHTKSECMLYPGKSVYRNLKKHMQHRNRDMHTYIASILLCVFPTVFISEPTKRLIKEPLGTVVRLTCNATRDDLIGLTWQVIIGGEGTATSLQAVLQAENISLSGDMTSSSQLEITGTERNSGSICTCEVNIPRQGDGFMQCLSEPRIVVFYGR